MALHPAVGVAQQHFHPFHAAQVLLIRFLNALLAHIVAADVVIVGFNLLLRHLANVAQGMTGRGVAVLADGATLDVEARELEKLLLEDAALLGRELRHEGLKGVFGVARITSRVPHLLHPLDELLGSDA